MSHQRGLRGAYHAFSCDGCGRIAGAHDDEREALAAARRVADVEGWQQRHPHWQFWCPDCATTAVPS